MFNVIPGVELMILSLQTLVVVLGLAISAIAYLGYRNNDSRPMLLVSVGFFLLAGPPAAIAVVMIVHPRVGQITASLLTQLSTVGGMASILYGLWMDPE